MKRALLNGTLICLFLHTQSLGQPISSLPHATSGNAGDLIPCTQGSSGPNSGTTRACSASQIVAAGGGGAASTAPANSPLLGSSGSGALQAVNVGSGLTLSGGALNTSYTAVNKAGDTMGGTLNVPTQATGNNSTAAASTAFVQNQIAATGGSGGGAGAAPASAPLLGSTSGGILQSVTVGAGLNLASGALGLASSFTLAPTAGTEPLQIVQTGINQDTAGLDVRRTVNQSGGTFGYVNNAIRAYTQVSGTSSNFEWALTARIDNSSTGNNNEVGAYLQGRCIVSGCSSTWGGTSEAVDFSGQANPPHGLIGHEFDVEADGSDSGANRDIIDLYCKQHDSNSSAYTTCGTGLRINTQGYAQYNNAALIQGNFYTGLLINGNGGYQDAFGLRFLGSFSAPAVDMSSATLAGDAIKMAAGQKFALEGTDTYFLSVNPANGTTYTNNTVAAFGTSSEEAVGLRMTPGYEGYRIRGMPLIGYDSEYPIQYNGTNVSITALSGLVFSSGLKINANADQGLAFSGSLLAVRAPNASGSAIAFQPYGGASNWAFFNSTGFNVGVPSFFGAAVTAPTPAAGDNSTNVATTAFVTSAVANASGSGGAWTSTTGSVGAASGTISGNYTLVYQRAGKTVNLKIYAIFTGGSGSTPLIGLPYTSANDSVGSICIGKESNSGTMLLGSISANSYLLGMSLNTNSYSPGSDTATMSCTYESQ